MSPSLYLAGPEVFHREALALGERKKALCTAAKFVGAYPLDGNEASSAGATIFAACLAMMRACDGGIFNLTPFRGPSADAGTVFELGFMAALGKPVFAYTNEPLDLIERVRAGEAVSRDEGIWRDRSGMAVEDFGNADNLMLDEALAAQGRRIQRRAVPFGERFTALAGFEACLAEAGSVFPPGR